MLEELPVACSDLEIKQDEEMECKTGKVIEKIEPITPDDPPPCPNNFDVNQVRIFVVFIEVFYD